MSLTSSEMARVSVLINISLQNSQNHALWTMLIHINSTTPCCQLVGKAHDQNYQHAMSARTTSRSWVWQECMGLAEAHCYCMTKKFTILFWVDAWLP